MTAFLGKFGSFSSPYSVCIVIPSALVIMLVTILYGNFSAELFSFILALGVLNASGWQIPTFIFTLFISLFSSVLVRKIERRLDLVFVSLILALLEMVLIVLIMVVFNENFTDLPKLLIGIAINGFLSGILTLGFLTPLEIILNTASVFRLMDLSDLNIPLMRKMLVSAGGTYNHSMMVAQLAENACRAIGANALIARVGAYYHDIGKIEQPEYFVENQKGQNKHDSISPTLSASVLKSHVKKGVEKARQMHLPQVIIDIIGEHHGNSVIAYFYNEAKEKDPSLSPEDFSYPGPAPTTKESAVVMLADTVEAACHTLESPSVPRLEKFITQLVNGKVEHKQLDNCGLTFRDVSKIKEAFVQVLAGYYHTRIEYPDQKDPSEDKNDAKPAETEGKVSDVKASDSEKKDGK
jgi:putative nucleotidyltransferase with HDIG domain